MMQIVKTIKVEFLKHPIASVSSLLSIVTSFISLKFLPAFIFILFVMIIFLLQRKSEKISVVLFILVILCVPHLKVFFESRTEFQILWPINQQEIEYGKQYTILGVGNAENELDYRFVNIDTYSQDCIGKQIENNGSGNFWKMEGCRLPVGNYKIKVFYKEGNNNIATDEVVFKIKDKVSRFKKLKYILILKYYQLIKK